MTDFYDDYTTNVAELYQATDAIRESEQRAFDAKWSKVKANVPANFIDFAQLRDQVVKRFPNMLGSDIEKAAMSPVLQNYLGLEISAALVDWVNLYRRVRMRQFIHTHMTMGKIEAGMNDEGLVEYSIPDGAMMTQQLADEIIQVVEAYGQFSATG